MLAPFIAYLIVFAAGIALLGFSFKLLALAFDGFRPRP